MASGITMYDSIYPAQLPAGARAYAGYMGGSWPTFATLQHLFPDALLLSIAVFASEDADCLDVESGDATIAQVYGWYLRQKTRGVKRPCIYTSVGNVDELVVTMTANGFTRSTYRLWSAHYGAGEHICGPRSCGLTATDCDGTQWTDSAFGRTLDQSLLAADFFVTQPAPQPKPAPQEDGMLVSAELTPGQPVVVSWPRGQVSNLNIVSGAAASVQVRWRHENPALPGGWFTEPDPVVIGADGGLAVIVAATMDDVNAAELTLDADGGPAHVHST